MSFSPEDYMFKKKGDLTIVDFYDNELGQIKKDIKQIHTLPIKSIIRIIDALYAIEHEITADMQTLAEKDRDSWYDKMALYNPMTDTVVRLLSQIESGMLNNSSRLGDFIAVCIREVQIVEDMTETTNNAYFATKLHQRLSKLLRVSEASGEPAARRVSAKLRTCVHRVSLLLK